MRGRCCALPHTPSRLFLAQQFLRGSQFLRGRRCALPTPPPTSSLFSNYSLRHPPRPLPLNSCGGGNSCRGRVRGRCLSLRPSRAPCFSSPSSPIHDSPLSLASTLDPAPFVCSPVSALASMSTSARRHTCLPYRTFWSFDMARSYASWRTFSWMKGLQKQQKERAGPRDPSGRQRRFLVEGALVERGWC